MITFDWNKEIKTDYYEKFKKIRVYIGWKLVKRCMHDMIRKKTT